MQFSAVTLLALAATALAYKNDTVIYTTEVVEVYTTVCPASSAITYGGKTYTNTLTKESTITLPCPCTVVKPVYTSTSVPVYTKPTYPVNSTTKAYVDVPKTTKTDSVGTTAPSVPASSSTVLTAGAGKTFALSGVSLVGLVGLAAFAL